jgi:tripartite-type tricarboxylate transporter receptor subunit TctC
MGRADPQAQIEGGVTAVMMSSWKQKLVLALVAALVSGIAGHVFAQDYPSRPITMIVPFPPGGGNDTMARIVAAKLSAALGQQVVVDNRGGANGLIAMRAGARAAPDGYTLIFANSSTTSINPALYQQNVGYDARKDFTPIGMFASTSLGIIAHPSFPAKSVAELIALAKREPGKLNIGTSPPGSASHLSAEMFKALAGVNVILVPYKGAAALTSDLLGGHIPVVFSVLPAALGNIQSGQLRVLAMTGRTRISLLPDVPTIAESGLPEFEAVIRYGLLAPAGTPKPIIERLNKELRALAESDEVKTRIRSEAGNALSSSPEQYAAEMAREDAVWGPLVRKLNIKVE